MTKKTTRRRRGERIAARATNANDDQKPLTVSVEEAGTLLGIGRDAAYQAVRSKKIPALRIGRYWRVPRVALDRMLASAGA